MPHASLLPEIIQGGMGVAVSGWRLARAVASRGQLGVVSGTAIDTVFVRRLQDGDGCADLDRAITHFPLPDVAGALVQRFPRRARGRPYRLLPLLGTRIPHLREQLMMLAAFVEVWLAKEGHAGAVGINLLTKVQLPTLPTLYGAMLAGVDYVLMGAGIPREIPAVLDRLVEHRPARWKLELEGAAGDDIWLEFDPLRHWHQPTPVLRRPRFVPIVASNSLATLLARKSAGRIDGLIVEGPAAGGHNAPPRGPARYSLGGEPLYGPRDEVDLAAVKALGLPFWVAGGAGHPHRLRAAQAAGAAGIQVGTLFAYCDESGLAEPLKSSVLASAAAGDVHVRTDARASPTGYPFKVVDWPQNPARGVTRERVCDLGYLRVAYRKPEGGIGFRCAGEPEPTYLRKGGRLEDTAGRQCLCNGLLAAAGHAQTNKRGRVEPPLVTSGDDLAGIAAFLGERMRYSAGDVIDYLLSEHRSAPSATLHAHAGRSGRAEGPVAAH
jgi:nitronate monooxygenase